MLAMNTQLIQNLKNGIEIAKSDYFNEASNGHWIKNSFNEDSISISRKGWGAFLLVTVTTKNRTRSMSYSGLYGTTLCADTGLLVADNGRPLGLSGNIVLKSNCYLPKAGIRPASIEGQSYMGAPQNEVFIRSAPRDIPHVNELFRNTIETQIGIGHPNNQDSMVENISPVMNHPFSCRTAVVNLGRGTIRHMNLKGNIKILGDDIMIDSTAHLENILIICSKIKFREGFHGAVHVIAQDSIITERDCHFDYPSSFVVLAGKEEGSLNSVQFGEGCIFSGGVVAFNTQQGGTAKVFVKLNSKSEINGLIYSGDYIHVEGKLNASIICSRLLIKTPSAVYENHLLGCEINPKKYASIMGVPMIFNRTGNLVCCKSL
jgi:hypothetical protein